jgi:hypothetical protein
MKKTTLANVVPGEDFILVRTKELFQRVVVKYVDPHDLVLCETEKGRWLYLSAQCHVTPII